MQVMLRCLDAISPNVDVILEYLPVHVGRAADCEVQLADRLSSRHHCVLAEREGLLIVRDLGSTHGTLVNGSRVHEEELLRPGDTFSVGMTTFQVDYTPEKAANAAGGGRGLLRWLKRRAQV